MNYKLLERNIVLNKKTKTFSDDDYEIFWEGFLFIKGFAPGEESLIQLVGEFKRNSRKNTYYPLIQLSGVFTCFIHDKKNKKIDLKLIKSYLIHILIL